MSTFALAIAVFATSTLSGVFGMGGGMLLMALLGSLYPVSTAMILHGAIQLVSNGSRAIMLRRYFCWPVVFRYAVGAGVSLAVFMSTRLLVDRSTLFVLLGSLPFLSLLVLRRFRLDVARGHQAVLCGALVNAVQLTAGASGPLLDVFFVRSRLNRFQIVATKALTQSVGHLIKIWYFSAWLELADSSDKALFGSLPFLMVAAILGTWTGRSVLNRLEELDFRRYSRGLLLFLGGIYMARGLFLVWR